jgi:hypothetical protein
MYINNRFSALTIIISIFGILAFIFLAIFGSTCVALFCWNHAIVYLFHLPKASFWQMFLFILFMGIIFSSIRVGGK